MRTQANGEAIRRLREEQGLTLTQLARRAEVSIAHLSRMENGDRKGSNTMRRKVADALGADLADISRPVPHVPRPRRLKAAA